MQGPSNGKIRRIDKSHSERSEVNHYFVDESGDLTLFGKGDRCILGTDGCSKSFMLGALLVSNPPALDFALDSLRRELLNDAAYKYLPSMQPGERKTASHFHAKNDHQSVRHRVFELLAQHPGLRVLVGVRQKRVFVKGIRRRIENGAEPAFGAKEHNGIYDGLVYRLFHHRLHKADRNEIVFSKRTKSLRTAALALAIETTKARFLKRVRHAEDSLCKVKVAIPHEHGGLQAVDYLLWALQRGIERGDWQSYDSVKHLYAHTHDVDDCRLRKSGTHYTKAKPLPYQNGIALW